MMRSTLAGIAVLLFAVGCNSIRTVPLTRTTGDVLIKDPERPLKGIPVMLKIPTHVEVTAYEVDYYYYDPGDASASSPRSESFNLVSSPCGPVRDFSFTIKQTDKMFVVDPIRPAAGQAAYGFFFGGPSTGNTFTDANGAAGSATGHGYLSGFNYKVVDQTILQTSALLTNALGILRGKTPTAPALSAGGGPSGAPFDNVITVKRAIAFRRFDISDPNLELEVDQFLAEFVNPSATEVAAH